MTTQPSDDDYVMQPIPDTDPLLRQIRREFFEVELRHLREARVEARRAREREAQQKILRARWRDLRERAYGALTRKPFMR
jgi:hypothetical protein